MCEKFVAITKITPTLRPHVERYLSAATQIATITGSHRELFSLENISDLVRPLRSDFSGEANFILGQLAHAGLNEFGIGNMQAWRDTSGHETSHVLTFKLQAAEAIEERLRLHEVRAEVQAGREASILRAQ
jgi:hypothetical protein